MKIAVSYLTEQRWMRFLFPRWQVLSLSADESEKHFTGWSAGYRNRTSPAGMIPETKHVFARAFISSRPLVAIRGPRRVRIRIFDLNGITFP